jgi:hypothetical protein
MRWRLITRPARKRPKREASQAAFLGTHPEHAVPGLKHLVRGQTATAALYDWEGVLAPHFAQWVVLVEVVQKWGQSPGEDARGSRRCRPGSSGV